MRWKSYQDLTPTFPYNLEKFWSILKFYSESWFAYFLLISFMKKDRNNHLFSSKNTLLFPHLWYLRHWKIELTGIKVKLFTREMSIKIQAAQIKKAISSLPKFKLQKSFCPLLFLKIESFKKEHWTTGYVCVKLGNCCHLSLTHCWLVNINQVNRSCII